MDARFPSLSHRQFLLMGSGTAVSALLGGAYLTSACPLSDSGMCVGPCTAYIDLDRDGICDRVQYRLPNGARSARMHTHCRTCVQTCPKHCVLS